MATHAQIAANRTNAQHSTGPTTPEGRAISRFNATRHGLAGSQVVIKDENPAEYDALRQELHAEYAPASEREAMLVDEVAQNWWRLQRARRIEAQLLEQYGELACFTDPDARRAFNQITRYLNKIERSWQKASAELNRAAKIRAAHDDDAAQAAAFLAQVRECASPEELRARIGFVSSMPSTPLRSAPSGQSPAGQERLPSPRRASSSS